MSYCPFCKGDRVRKSKHSDNVICPDCCEINDKTGDRRFNAWIPLAIYNKLNEGK
jgi:hypothetical protein